MAVLVGGASLGVALGELREERQGAVAAVQAQGQAGSEAQDVGAADRVVACEPGLGRRLEYLYALTYSMPGCVEAVVEAEGDVTKY